MIKRFDKKENLGITLIALVITIVVLIVLAGVIISITLGNGGIIDRAKTAKQEYANAQDYEEKQISTYGNYIDSVTSVREGANFPIVDVTNVLANVSNDNTSSWTNSSCSYTATQKCYIMGYIQSYNNGTVNIKINNVFVGKLFVGDSATSTAVPINYLLDKGDKIEFESSSSNIKELVAYGIK